MNNPTSYYKLKNTWTKPSFARSSNAINPAGRQLMQRAATARLPQRGPFEECINFKMGRGGGQDRCNNLEKALTCCINACGGVGTEGVDMIIDVGSIVGQETCVQGCKMQYDAWESQSGPPCSRASPSAYKYFYRK